MGLSVFPVPSAASGPLGYQLPTSVPSNVTLKQTITTSQTSLTYPAGITAVWVIVVGGGQAGTGVGGGQAGNAVSGWTVPSAKCTVGAGGTGTGGLGGYSLYGTVFAYGGGIASGGSNALLSYYSHTSIAGNSVNLTNIGTTGMPNFALGVGGSGLYAGAGGTGSGGNNGGLTGSSGGAAIMTAYTGGTGAGPGNYASNNSYIGGGSGGGAGLLASGSNGGATPTYASGGNGGSGGGGGGGLAGAANNSLPGGTVVGNGGNGCILIYY